MLATETPWAFRASAKRCNGSGILAKPDANGTSGSANGGIGTAEEAAEYESVDSSMTYSSWFSVRIVPSFLHGIFLNDFIRP